MFFAEHVPGMKISIFLEISFQSLKYLNQDIQALEYGI